jgi:hypothetical protein
MKTFSIREAFKHGWALFKGHQKVLILSTAITLIVGGFKQSDGRGFGGFLMWLVVTVVGVIIQIGWWKIVLMIEDGHSPKLKELISHPELFWRYLGASLALMLMTVVGLILLVVPGVYLLVRFQYAPMLVVDKRYTIRQAFEHSSRLTHGLKWRLLGLMSIVVLLNILGAIALVVGLLVTVPVTMLAYTHIYRHLSRERSINT